MYPFLDNLKRQATANPMIALAAGATVLTAVTQFLGAAVNARNARSWAKEVARRSVKDASKM